MKKLRVKVWKSNKGCIRIEDGIGQIGYGVPRPTGPVIASANIPGRLITISLIAEVSEALIGTIT